MDDSKKVIIGKFGQSYGIKGWLKVHSLTDPINNILQYWPWQILQNSSWRPVKVTDSKYLSKNIIVKLAECDTPESAKLYANLEIAVEREQLPSLPAEEFYWTDLIGLKVINQDGVDFGMVDSLFATGSNDVLVVKNGRRRLLPYTKDVIYQVDLTSKRIRVVWDADF